jgi:[protein-PII] uridylyltransferase
VIAALPSLPTFEGDPRAFLAAGRERVAEVHRAGGSGHAVVRLQSALMDTLVQGIFARARQEAEQKHPPSPLALVAIGGYGRRELAPYSDLDLLFLHPPGEPDDFARLASERLLYALWDLKLEVGHSVRDLAACQRAAAEDHTARTALLDLRFLAGDERLYRELERAQLHEIPERRIEGFIADKLREMRARRERFGDSLYLLEPNVKQSEGGLRDLQAALWVTRARFKVAGLSDILARALLPEREVGELRLARDFIWRIRNELHYLAGHKSDQLTFEVQPRVAARMGFVDGEHGSGVEELMRSWYLSARTVLSACDALVDRCLEAAASASRESRERPLPGGELKVFNGRLTITDAAVLRRSPAALVRLFATADREGLDLYPYARDHAAQAAREMSPTAAADPELNQELIACFTRTGTRGRFLSLMHDLGVLPAVIPEFGRVTARRQNDLYHVYTVDVHSLRAVRRLFALRCGDIPEAELTALMQGMRRPLGCYLGTLFHDVGKGGGPDHSGRGAELAAQACLRFGIDPEDAADVEWLVLKHLRMPHLSQRRDLSDPELIHDFAEECGTFDRLEKLYLLTYADICTVGPNTWSDWKGRLLAELYQKTREVLAAEGRPRPPPGTAEASGRGQAARALAGRDAEEVASFLTAMPARYFLSGARDDAPAHFRLLRRGGGRPFAAAIRHRPALGHSDLAITASDRPGLLALVAGSLAAHRIDIQRAEVFSTGGGAGVMERHRDRALDLFEVRGPTGGSVEPARWRAARADLATVLQGTEEVEALIARRLRPSVLPQKPLPRVPTKVVVDNASARHHTVVDVYTADRIGLLYDVASTLFGLGLSVDVARISTEGHRAADAFYVRGQDGRPLEGQTAQRVVDALVAALSRGP